MIHRLKKFVFTLGVAALGNAAVYPTTIAQDMGYEWVCHGAAQLAHGKSLLKEALEQDRPALFVLARAALEQSAECQIAEATFLLGVMHCQGRGAPRNRSLGMKFISKAVSLDRRWVVEYIDKPNLCPKAK